MRKQAPLIPRIASWLVVAMVMAFATGTVSADSRADARTHYQAGVKFYNGGDYKSAIREFSAAQSLAPADLNNYNLALCYDKLGDPEPAVQYYRAYLDKQPSSDKRAEIEASINRLESASKSVAAKKAEEARKIEDARRAEDTRRAADDAKRAEELAKKQAADDAKRASDDARRAEEARRTEDARRPPPIEDRRDPNAGVGTGSPSAGGAPTGDAQLDRVQQIDIGSMRGQRGGGNNGSDPRGGPAKDPRVAAADPNGAPPPNGNAAPNAAPNPNDVPKAKPVYKKWWFWAVVAVSAYVVYAIATEDSEQQNFARPARTMLPPGAPAQQSGGMTLLRW